MQKNATGVGPVLRSLSGVTAVLRSLPATARYYVARLVAYGIYVGTSVVAITAIVVGTATGLIWVGTNVVPSVPWLMVLYLVFGSTVLMAEFTVFHRAFKGWGTVVFHLVLGEEDRDERRTAHH
ncbi:hypothetical protein [Halomicrococcus gelatinilyticus]|uniref:hypothetical protein n=1 Tax=Halomicrococcus gelatinilyticus TaxID=1702103 RepID=UPI002E15D3EA